MSGARDSYQPKSAKDQRAAEFRRVQLQRELQQRTAIRTIENCLTSTDRRKPGTFANDVLTALVAAADGEGEWLARRLVARGGT